MGHSRLGEMPKTGYWKDVIRKLDLFETPEEVAKVTAKAAHLGLELAKKDIGLSNVIFLLMKSLVASRQKQFVGELSRHSMRLSDSSGISDFIGELDAAIDRSLRRVKHRSHLAEMARFSAIDSLQDVFSSQSKSLFGDDIELTRLSIKAQTTKKNFVSIGQKFWGCFLSRFLDYHLSRQIANHIGPEKPIKNLSEYNSFRKAFDRHCRETVEIVKDFTACWPSVAEFKGGLTAEKVRAQFVPIALEKIKRELALR